MTLVEPAPHAIDWAEVRAAAMVKLLVETAALQLNPALCAVWIDLLACDLRTAHQEGRADGIASCEGIIHRLFAGIE